VTFEFDDFIVDADARWLKRKGIVVHLPPKAFDLLVILIRERPRAVTRAELIERVWPGVFVTTASLSTAIADLRGALGDSASTPRYVRTVNRHGYAFEPAKDPSGRPAARSGHALLMATGRVPLRTGDNIVGRDPTADILVDAPGVSRRHARIRVGVRGVTIEDLGSKNGTSAHGIRVANERPLADGDEIAFGSVRATFRSIAHDATLTDEPAS